MKRLQIRYMNDPACGIYYLLIDRTRIKVINEQEEYVWSKSFTDEIENVEVSMGNFSTVTELIKLTMIDDSQIVYSTQGTLLYDSRYKDDVVFDNCYEENKAPVLKSLDVSPGFYKIELELDKSVSGYQLFDTRGNCIYDGDSHNPVFKILVLDNEVLQIKSYDPIKIESLQVHATEYEKKICVIGDSTLANQMLPYWSWSQMLQAKSGFTVVNFAISGRSTKSFELEGRFKRVWDTVKAGDKLLIGFGHNDQKVNYFGTNIEEYKNNIETIIDCCLKRGVEPIIVTPIARRLFVNDVLKETLEPYLSHLKQYFSKFIIDTNKISKDLILSMSIEESKKIYVHNKQMKIIDNTHTSLYGARSICDNFIIELNKKKN